MKAVTERKGHWEKITARKKIINEVLKDEFPGSLWEDAAYLIEAARRLNEEASLWTGPMFYYNQAVNLVQAIRDLFIKLCGPRSTILILLVVSLMPLVFRLAAAPVFSPFVKKRRRSLKPSSKALWLMAEKLLLAHIMFGAVWLALNRR